MEVDAEIHSQALGLAPGIQLKRGRRDYISKCVSVCVCVCVYVCVFKIIMGKPREIAFLSSWELTDSELTARETAWDQTRPSACG